MESLPTVVAQQTHIRARGHRTFTGNCYRAQLCSVVGSAATNNQATTASVPAPLAQKVSLQAILPAICIVGNVSAAAGKRQGDA